MRPIRGVVLLLAPAMALTTLTVVPVFATASNSASAVRTSVQLSKVSPRASTTAANARIARMLASRVRNPRLGPDLAVRVMDPATRRVIYSQRSSEGQLPASNAKIITAFVALATMGPDARRTTRVVSGPVPNSVVIVGGGDPMLTGAHIDLLAQRTVQAVRAATAPAPPPSAITVKYDDSLFPTFTRPTGWRTDYVPGEVNPVSALARYGVRSTNPARDAARYFAARLTARGMAAVVTGRTTSSKGSTLASVQGYTLLGCLDSMLKNSDNNIAETISRNSAMAVGDIATWSGARRSANKVLLAQRIPMSHVVLADGSGLSRATTIPASTMAWVLVRAMTSSDHRLGLFLDELPLAGRSGSLATKYHRYDTRPSKCAVGLVEAKTGYLSGVYSLSGVAVAADGRPRVFSLLANHVSNQRYSGLEVRRALDSLAATVTGCY